MTAASVTDDMLLNWAESVLEEHEKETRSINSARALGVELEPACFVDTLTICARSLLEWYDEFREGGAPVNTPTEPRLSGEGG